MYKMQCLEVSGAGRPL